MSCVAGLVNKKRVYMAADSAANLDNLYIPEKIPKLLRFGDRENPDLLIGCVGSTRVIQILEHYFDPMLDMPSYHTDTLKYMVTVFIRSLKAALHNAGFISSINEKESGVSLLVGAAGRLFNVMSDYQVSEPSCEYDAIGSFGAIAIALGSLHTTEYVDKYYRIIEPHRRVLLAVEAAMFHETNCGGEGIMEEHHYVHTGDR